MNIWGTWGAGGVGDIIREGLYLYSGLHQVQPQGQGFSHEDIRVVAFIEGFFQLLQLPSCKIRPGPPSLTPWAFLVRVRVYKKKGTDPNQLIRNMIYKKSMWTRKINK